MELEQQMIERCQLATEYYIERITKLNNKWSQKLN
jgi:hypothetical protein